MSSTSKKLFKLKHSKLQETFNTIDAKDETEVKLLNAPKETDEIFRKLGAPSKAVFVNDQLKDYYEMKAYQSKYNGYEAFRTKDIKKLCNTYFLQLLTLDNLYAYLPDSTMLTIKRFTEKYDIAVVDSFFFILCPREYFEKRSYGKEAKTFIIFFRDEKGTSSRNNHRRVNQKETLLQLASSGKDFPAYRRWFKAFDINSYANQVGSAYVNIISAIFIILTIFSSFIWGLLATTLLLIATMIIIFIINMKYRSDFHWNNNTEWTESNYRYGEDDQ